MNPEATGDSQPVLVGYDESPGAANAIGVGGRLLPGRRAVVVHFWAPPFPDPDLRQRLWRPNRSLDEYAELLEHEGAAEAERVAGEGVALCSAAGWQAEARTQKSYGDKGFDLARISQERSPVAAVVGSSGLSGVRAALGSTSDGVVHYSPVPVLVVPYPLLDSERQAASDGPVLVGTDGSDGAKAAVEAAGSIFSARRIEVAAVTSGNEEPDPDVREAVELSPAGVLDNARAVADALIGHARQQGSALIVVGSRGRSQFRELLLGSVATAVLHHAHRPVLVVPEPAAGT